jgi:hypothetical protein
VCAAAEQSIDDAGTLSVDGTFYIEHILKRTPILQRTHAVGGAILKEQHARRAFASCVVRNILMKTFN